MAKTLTLGKGKNKRQWELSDDEFEIFETMFEENELIDFSAINFSKCKLTLAEFPKAQQKAFI